MANDLQLLLEDLKQTVETVSIRLLQLNEREVTNGAAGQWSKKEILGHLIDSACNNHQRFIRAQLERHLVFPGYAQDAWVHLQSYNSEPWETLISLWKDYNLHLIHLMSRIPPEQLATLCLIGGDGPFTLQFLVADYVRHLKHHVEQILAPPRRIIDATDQRRECQ